MSTTTATPITNPQDKRLFRLSSAALAENLRQQCSSEPDQSLVESWMHAIRLEIRRRRSSHFCTKDDDDHTALTASFSNLESSLSEDDLVQAVQQEGFFQWQKNTQSYLPTIAPASNSNKVFQQVSLLQFGGGGSLMSSFVTWDRLQASDEPLQLLRDIQHLDDLLPDWNQHVQPYFLQGLLQQQRQDDFLELHRIWFDKSRSSTEYRALQIGLCQNLLTAVRRQPQQQCDRIVALALHMFSDWMLRGLYVHDERVWSIGRTLWGWLILSNSDDDDPSSSTTTTRMMIQSILIQADPQATWFSAWLAHLAPSQSRQLVLEDTHQTLLGALQSCSSHLVGKNNNNNEQDEHRTCCFWLAIVRSLIVSTRVARFTWDKILVSEAFDGKDVTTTGPEEMGQQKTKVFVFDLFVRLMEMCSSGDEIKINTRSVLMMCADAIETMLRGCRNDEQIFPAMRTKVAELERQRDKDSLCHRLLENILARLQGH